MTIDREKISRALFDALDNIDDVVSVTLVGSICDRNSIDVVSDIDAIVIVDVLTESVFNACIEHVGRVSGADLGLPGKNVYINSTFGPLKFDTAEQVVIHLMIYDVAGHRNHVLKSPFTCLDWERSQLVSGKTLREVYPVLCLSVDHFQNARRGIEDYMRDLDRGCISYREYAFHSGNVVEVECEQELDTRLKGEYAYHIVKNLVQNYAKLIRGENRAYTWSELCEIWENYLPSSKGDIPFFTELYELKTKGAKRFPADAPAKAASFLKMFFTDLQAVWDAAPVITWVRHARTALNDGSFLGQGRDPGILSDQEVTALEIPFDVVYSSPAQRSLQTAACLAPGHVAREDACLHEIHYGEAEGLLFSDAIEAIPALPVGWARGEDPSFPGGENSGAVAQRVRMFLDKLSSGTIPEQILVVSHNVTTRCLVGLIADLPMTCWFRLPVNHLEAFDLRWVGGHWILNLRPEQHAAIGDALAGE